MNASPDLRQQIEASPSLHPRHGLRSSPLAGVILTNADVDAVAGLLHLREGTPFAIYGSANVLTILDQISIFDVVNRRLVPRRELRTDKWQVLLLADETPSGLEVRPFDVPGKLPLYLEGGLEDSAVPEDRGSTLAIEIRGGESRFVYAANCAEMNGEVAGRLEGTPVVFFDGTLFTDDGAAGGRGRRIRSGLRRHGDFTVTVAGIDRIESAEALERMLLRIGEERYHNLHPFHRLLHGGKLDRGQVQAWALNRYYYQSRIPMKDSALMARITDPKLRREWSQRVFDHDGTREGDGGIARWLQLCVATGLDEAAVRAETGILPATRFAVDAYVRFVSEKTLLEAIASSLTELFAPGVIRERVSGMLGGYDFIDEATLAYFKPRLNQAPRDAEFALSYVKEHATTPELRQRACEALLFKCDVLWSQLDALHSAYVLGGGIPPGAFVPADETILLGKVA
ncbi:MAG: pyrroloquinoline-quinone synthase PqqC [Rhizobiales bacterium]|nr:pyrroloquinoline-quinone synthase PqqC [Hyphomicrobiales bacterium]